MNRGRLARWYVPAAAGVAVVALLVACDPISQVENSLLFPASHVPLGEPASRGVPAFRTQHLTTADRLTLTFWAAPAQPDMPTIIDLHGDGSRASDDMQAGKVPQDQALQAKSLHRTAYLAEFAAHPLDAPERPSLIAWAQAARDMLIDELGAVDRWPNLAAVPEALASNATSLDDLAARWRINPPICRARYHAESGTPP